MYIVHDLESKTSKECNSIDEVKHEMIRINSCIYPETYFYNALDYIEVEGMNVLDLMVVVSDIMKAVDQNQLVVTDKDDETSIYFTF